MNNQPPTPACATTSRQRRKEAVQAAKEYVYRHNGAPPVIRAPEWFDDRQERIFIKYVEQWMAIYSRYEWMMWG